MVDLLLQIQALLPSSFLSLPPDLFWSWVGMVTAFWMAAAAVVGAPR